MADRLGRPPSHLPPNGLYEPGYLERLRALNISLADGFALATAQARDASVASFDRRVRRALPKAGLQLATCLR